MIPQVKRCSRLVMDKDGRYWCKSTHVCYRCVCLSDMMVTVLHLGAYIHTITADMLNVK